MWAVAEHNQNSLAAFRRRIHWRADAGKAGGGSKCHGADGTYLEVPVPPGTIIRNRDASNGDAPIAELLYPGALGNLHAASQPSAEPAARSPGTPSFACREDHPASNDG